MMSVIYLALFYSKQNPVNYIPGVVNIFINNTIDYANNTKALANICKKLSERLTALLTRCKTISVHMNTTGPFSCNAKHHVT